MLLKTKGTKLFTEQDVLRVAKKLTNKKCKGVDNIPMNVIKIVSPRFSGIITDLFNTIAETKLPSLWKRAVITPLHKKGKKTNVENYRPISNLCRLGKFYEKCLLEKIMEHAKVNHINIYGTNQHAYRQNHSTTTACLTLQSMIAKELDSGNNCIVYSMDLSAAFDLLRPEIMEKNLQNLPIALSRPIIDFLTDREYVVDVNGKRSNVKKITVGCVQGSVLGPCLFSIYFNELEKVLQDKDIDLVTYADDTYVLVKGKNLQDITERTEVTLKKHFDFLEGIGMVVNKSKTEATVFSTTRNTIHLRVDNETIETLPGMKVLGINFTHNLDWSYQVEKAITKARGCVKRLQLMRKFLTFEITLKLITSFYFSAVYYGAAVWMTQDLKAKDWKLLEAAHYKAMRVAARDYKQVVPKVTLDETCKRATPRQWSSYISAATAIRIIQNNEPLMLNTQIRKNMYINARNPNKPHFFDYSKHKIGKQCVSNRIMPIFKSVCFPWYNLNLSRDSIRVGLKKSFFPYILLTKV